MSAAKLLEERPRPTREEVDQAITEGAKRLEELKEGALERSYPLPQVVGKDQAIVRVSLQFYDKS